MIELPKKAGMIPYLIDDTGAIMMLFMVSSNPKFGGPHPMISKGGIDDGEDEIAAAIREAHEELGLRMSNLIDMPWLFFSERVVLSKSAYDLDLYACLVYSAANKDFDIPHYETKFTIWLTPERFQIIGRKDHRPIVQTLAQLITDKHVVFNSERMV